MSEKRGEPSHIEITPATRFKGRALLVCGAFGMVLLLPTLIAMAAVSLRGLGVLTLALPLLTLSAATFCLPFGFGNSYIKRLMESLRPRRSPCFLVQLSFVPPLRSGVRGLFEDADDVGWLSCTRSGLAFEGDSVRLFVPVSQVKTLKRQTSGARGLWLYSRIEVEVSGFDRFGRLRFAERASLLLPQSRRITRDIYETMRQNLVSPSSPVVPATG